ncbi:NUDIX domain-containing protein [Streptomyces sp. NPDC057011]|uniref:NUDIX domain-containing protein n=1 Tax=unclassified Streptomyces TaxID=2593676 RepID=UPI003632013D
MGELVERVDEYGRHVGVVERRDAIRNGWLHRIAATVCRDRRGRFLVHRRAGHLTRFPDQYELLFGGAVAVGESCRTAASRELAEETGMEVPVRFVGAFLNRSGLSPHWMGVHEAVIDHEQLQGMRLDPGEVAWSGWLTYQELQEFIGRHTFTPDSHEVLARYLTAPAPAPAPVPEP